MLYSRIISTGSYLPEKILSNQDLERIVDTSDEWITSRSGIKERHIIAIDESTIDMAYKASIDALKNSNLNKNDIDLIIVATFTSNIICPSVACTLQKRLEITNNIPAFDLQAACSGFIYALTTADCYIKNNMAKTILVVGVDAMSNIINYNDRNTCILFGDGAGAVILQSSHEAGIIGSEIYADGTGDISLNVNGGIRGGKIVGSPYLYQDGKTVFKMAVKNLTAVASTLLNKTGYKKEQIDWLIPHQANIRIIEAAAKTLSIPMDKVIVTLEKHGNTSAASVPLALDYGVKSNKIKRGDILMLEGVGAGFTWGANLIRY